MPEIALQPNASNKIKSDELQRVAQDLQQALDEFRNDARLSQLAEQDVPDAKHRLQHVLKLTDDAAHRTLDLVEQSIPLAERTAALLRTLTASANSEALAGASRDMDALRANLTETLLAQGYQDLSGQILRGVMKLVGEIELVLSRLVVVTSRGEKRKPAARPISGTELAGPVVPGVAGAAVVGAQGDVDDLLTGLGL